MSAARLTFVFMVWADTLSGQSAQISGVIRDPSDLGIKDAQVGILNEQAGGRRNARSNESGSYSLPSLNPGRYRVTVRALGFETTMQEGVKLEVGESAQIDFTMHLGDPHSVLTVRADAHSMNTESAAVGTVIDRNTIDQMPLNGRGIQSLIELSPGVAHTSSSNDSQAAFQISPAPSIVIGPASSRGARQLQGVDNFSYRLGTHQLKAGADYRWYSPVQRFPRFQNSFSFSSLYGQMGAYSGIIPVQALYYFAEPETAFVFTAFSAYLQDSWRASPN